MPPKNNYFQFEEYQSTVWPNFLGVEAILITKLEVGVLKLKRKLFGKYYFFYFLKCKKFFFNYNRVKRCLIIRN
jgi:hypothetical protein